MITKNQVNGYSKAQFIAALLALATLNQMDAKNPEGANGFLRNIDEDGLVPFVTEGLGQNIDVINSWLQDYYGCPNRDKSAWMGEIYAELIKPASQASDGTKKIDTTFVQGGGVDTTVVKKKKNPKDFQGGDPVGEKKEEKKRDDTSYTGEKILNPNDKDFSTEEDRKRILDEEAKRIADAAKKKFDYPEAKRKPFLVRFFNAFKNQFN